MSASAANTRGIDDKVVKAALFVMGIGAAGMLFLKPLIVGGLIDSFGYSPRQAGFVAGTEMAGVGLGTLIVAALGAGWSGRRIAAAGAAIGLLGTVGPAAFDAFPVVLAFRLVAGIGCGVLVSVVISAIATSRDPDRTFSLYYGVSSVVAAAMFPAATALTAADGVRAAYLMVAALLLPVFFLLRFVPPRRAAASGAAGVSAPGFPFGRAAASLSASVVYWTGTGAVWSFIERIGLGSGLSAPEVGNVLAASQLLFVLGAFCASVVHTRIGRWPPALAGVLLSILALGVMRFSGSGAGFTAGVMMFAFAWMFFFPYMSGVMAAQDPLGRIAVLGVPSQTLGLAIGPAVAGTLVAGSGYGAVIALGAACYAVAIVILLPALVAAGRPSPAVAASVR